MVTSHCLHRSAQRCVLALLVVTLFGCRGRESAEVEVEIRSVGVDRDAGAPVLVLQDKAKRVALPIWIGPAEAQAIAMQLEGINPPRPMTHDLMKTALDQAGVEFERVVIGDLKDSTYYARIFLRSGRKDLELDSRPSDAIALAVRFHKPIFVARALLRQDVAIDLRQPGAVDGAFTFAGITVQELTDELAGYFELPPGNGVLVADVARNARAGVQRGDVILEMDGDKIANLTTLQKKIAGLPAGTHVDLAVKRGSAQIHVDLTIE
ncbi:MAG TPA: bifunctional nuclease domain-containing protein [Candidatus Kryptonia bacterium]|nr:bifunctional nuclease domain-containing protein [Candidatus Kryptonia bacterium]